MKFSKTSIKKVKKEIEKNKDRGPMFTVTSDNLDVKINRDIKGKWKGFKFSELREDGEGFRLLCWIAGGNFDEKVVRIAEEMTK